MRHAKGFEVAMDDFGSGYSSLNMLAQISIDELKLDRGFLRNGCEGKDSNNRIILEQILSLAHKLGISTVAEGIETEEDESLLKQLGCECGQGYLYSRPISAQEFHERYMKKEED
ncbi:MAG: EAL domain-containing protein [Ruminococcus sp.]